MVPASKHMVAGCCRTDLDALKAEADDLLSKREEEWEAL
jgi:hypothetical protein